MASLVEELVTVLEEEEKIYQTLISYGEKKTDILIRADVPELEKLTCLEQLASDDLVTHSNQQVQLLKDIANVLGRTEEKMTVTRLITLLESQPEFHDPLSEISEKLGKLAKRLKDVNAHNQNLIQESLKMIEYNINLLQNLDRAPETAEYSRDMFKRPAAYGDAGAGVSGQFDTKN